MTRRENMIGERDGLMHGNGKRERYMCAVMSKILHENKNKIHIYSLWRCSQAKIQFKSSQKTRWHARTRLGDSRFKARNSEITAVVGANSDLLMLEYF